MLPYWERGVADHSHWSGLCWSSSGCIPYAGNSTMLHARMAYIIPAWRPFCHLFQRFCHIGPFTFILNPTLPVALAGGDDDVLVVIRDGIVQWFDSVDGEVRRHLILTCAIITRCGRINGESSWRGSCEGPNVPRGKVPCREPMRYSG